MRNSPRLGSRWTGHRCTPIVPAGDQVARRLEHQAPGVADRQEGELGAAGQVPEHRALVRCRRPGPGHHGGSRGVHNPSAHERHGRTSGIPGPDRPGTGSVGPRCATTIRPSWLKSGAIAARSGSARAGPGSGPRAGAGLPSRCWPAACRRGGTAAQAAVVMAFEGRPPDAGRGVPEVDLGVVARRRQRACRRGSRRRQSTPAAQGERPDELAGLRLEDPAGRGSSTRRRRRRSGPRRDGRRQRSARPGQVRMSRPVARS